MFVTKTVIGSCHLQIFSLTTSIIKLEYVKKFASITLPYRMPAPLLKNMENKILSVNVNRKDFSSYFLSLYGFLVEFMNYKLL